MAIMKRKVRRDVSGGHARRQRGRRVPLALAMVSAALLVACAGWSAGAQDAVEITVREDEYVQPAAEMLGTDTYPDIISLTTGDLQVTVLPNRGRPLWGLTLSGDQPLLFSTAMPMPHMGDDGRYSLEFGGLYLSVPWNVRDNQPADLSYTVDRARDAVILSGIDSETAVTAEQVVRLAPNGSGVAVDVRLTNPGDVPASFPLRVYLLAGPNDSDRWESELRLPISAVVIGPNAGWMGAPGTEVPWPAAWSRWSRFEDEGGFTARWFGVPGLKDTSVAVDWPVLGRSLQVTWSPSDRFGQVKVEAFGLTYRDVLGGEPYWRIILQQPDDAPVRLGPGEELHFGLRLAVGRFGRRVALGGSCGGRRHRRCRGATPL